MVLTSYYLVSPLYLHSHYGAYYLLLGLTSISALTLWCSLLTTWSHLCICTHTMVLTTYYLVSPLYLHSHYGAHYLLLGLTSVSALTLWCSLLTTWSHLFICTHTMVLTTYYLVSPLYLHSHYGAHYLLLVSPLYLHSHYGAHFLLLGLTSVSALTLWCSLLTTWSHLFICTHTMVLTSYYLVSPLYLHSHYGAHYLLLGLTSVSALTLWCSLLTTWSHLCVCTHTTVLTSYYLVSPLYLPSHTVLTSYYLVSSLYLHSHYGADFLLLGLTSVSALTLQC